MLTYLFFVYRISMFFLLGFLFIFSTLKYSKFITLAILSGSFILTGILDAINFFYLQQPQYTAVVVVLQIAMTQITAVLISQYRDCRAVFTGITSSTYVLLGNILAIIIYLYTSNIILGVAIQVVIHALLLFGLTFEIRAEYQNVMEGHQKMWLGLCLLPTMFYVVVNSIVSWSTNLISNPQSGISAILVVLLMVFVYLLIGKLFAQQRTEYELNKDKEFLEMYARWLKTQANIGEKKDYELAKFRHDCRHYLNLLASYLEEQEYEKIGQLVSDSNLVLDNSIKERYCDNVALNAIVGRWNQEALEKGVRFTWSLDIPKDFANDSLEFELAAVISNLLENAIQESKKLQMEEKRSVDLVVKRSKGHLAIKISNFYEGEKKIDEKTNLPISEKGKNHGYGLRNVKSFVNKYQGIFECNFERGMAVVRLLIRIL